MNSSLLVPGPDLAQAKTGDVGYGFSTSVALTAFTVTAKHFDVTFQPQRPAQVIQCTPRTRMGSLPARSHS